MQLCNKKKKILHLKLIDFLFCKYVLGQNKYVAGKERIQRRHEERGYVMMIIEVMLTFL